MLKIIYDYFKEENLFKGNEKECSRNVDKPIDYLTMNEVVKMQTLTFCLFNC